MTTKISVTKKQLLDIANAEFINEPNYKPEFKITDVKLLGNSFLFEIPISKEEDLPAILNSQEFADKLASRYSLVD